MANKANYINEYLEHNDGSYEENGFWKIIGQDGKTLLLENRFGGHHEHDLNDKDILYLDTTSEEIEKIKSENSYVLDKKTGEKVYVEFGNHFEGVNYLLFKALSKMYPSETYYKECLECLDFIPVYALVGEHVKAADDYYRNNIELSGANYGKWYYAPLKENTNGK